MTMVDGDDNNDDIRIMDMVRQRVRKNRAAGDPDGRDRFYGLVYSRKKKRVAHSAPAGEDNNNKNRCAFAVVMNPSCGGNADVYSRFLFAALSYVTRLTFTLKEPSEFLLMEPFCDVYASQGIRFVQGPVPHSVGVCQFFGITQLMPLFCVDFSAVPLCFMYLHSAMSLRSMFRSLLLVYNPEYLSSNLAGQNGQYRKNSKCIQGITSLTRRKGPNPAMTDTSNGAPASDFNDEKLTSLANCYATVSPTEELDLSLCSTNILIPESEDSDINYYRVGGAVVTFEQKPSSREWLLTVKRNGLTWCSFKAEKLMRTYTYKKFTHWRLFSLDNGWNWKLEFANDQDWTLFKALYKQCFGPNFPARVVPVPRIRDVSGYEERYSVPFHRPRTYISANGDDELGRAMTRKTAHYDMDSEDEEWLAEFNNDVSKDNFELIVDTLEKDFYFNQNGRFDAKSAANRCPWGLGTKEVVQAVSRYWMTKRKRKHTHLLRVFQNYQSNSKITPLIPQHFLRKRRSLRKHKRYDGGKYRGVWQEIAAEQNALKEMQKIEDAKASANALKEIAIQKRKRAQLLLKKADLAMYRAITFIRIAEAAEARKSNRCTSLTESLPVVDNPIIFSSIVRFWRVKLLTSNGQP
ncbi:Enhancer of polycomb protein 1 [Spatholobus suberectus]|nr:Enhancer of polycomb protein 1 [Spatholobus suberectus]